MKPVDALVPDGHSAPAAVYLLQRYDGQRFKIGWALEPISRVRRLPEFQADELDLVGSHVAWLPTPARAQQIERALHRGLATFQAVPPHQLDGYTEWFRPEAHRTALGMIRQMPMGSRASMAPAVMPFLCEFGESLDFDLDPAEDGAALAAQDVLWRMEDVLVRVAATAPVVVEGSAGQQVVRIVAFRRRLTGAAEGLRRAVLDIDRYRWQASTHTGAKTGSFVQLIEYQGDDLLLRLAPMRMIKSWFRADLAGACAGGAPAFPVCEAPPPVNRHRGKAMSNAFNRAVGRAASRAFSQSSASLASPRWLRWARAHRSRTAQSQAPAGSPPARESLSASGWRCRSRFGSCTCGTSRSGGPDPPASTQRPA